MLPLRSLRVFSHSFALARFHTAPTIYAKKKVVHQFRLADIGEGITECEVIKWSVKPSSVVQSFDPLCEVQSDKASVEITSPFDGVVKDLLVREGEVAKVGEGLCLIEVEEEEDGRSVQASDPEPEVHSASEFEKASSQRKPHPHDPSNNSELPKIKVSHNDVWATPSVRHYAKLNGVDVAAIPAGSGKNGRIERKDVENYLTSSSTPSQSLQLSKSTHKQLDVEFGRTRFAMWKAMTKSLEIPHFGYSTTLDLTRLSEWLPTLNAHIPVIYSSLSPAASIPSAVSPHAIFLQVPLAPEADPTMHYNRLTFLPFLLKTLSRAMYEWPLFRSSISSPHPDPSSKQKPRLSVRSDADISIALSTPTGLYTPTLTAVNKLNVYAIMGQLRRLQHLGRQTPCALGPTDMPKHGGTITVSNIGAIGKGEFAAPLLVPGGGVAIVAIGRVKWVDVVPEDGIGMPQRRLVVGVSWSADHRVVEGAEMAAFVETWRRWVEHPEIFVGDAL